MSGTNSIEELEEAIAAITAANNQLADALRALREYLESDELADCLSAVRDEDHEPGEAAAFHERERHNPTPDGWGRIDV